MLYLATRSTDCELPLTHSHRFDKELVSKITGDLKRVKALDVDGLAAEHLQFCRPILCVI